MEKFEFEKEIPKKQILDAFILKKELGGDTIIRIFFDEDGATLTVNFGGTESYEKKTVDHKEAMRIFNYIHQKPSKAYLKKLGFEVN